MEYDYNLKCGRCSRITLVTCLTKDDRWTCPKCHTHNIGGYVGADYRDKNGCNHLFV